MRGKRAKQYRKLMHQYSLSFNFREPYQVLVDAEMIQDTCRYRMDLPHLLERTLHGTVKPMITQCSIRHLYLATHEDRAEKNRWIETAKTFERRRCGHHELEQPLSVGECLLSVVDGKESGANKHRYIVASQDAAVRARIRQIAGVPLVYVSRSVMVMEPMASKSESVRNGQEVEKIRAGVTRGRGPATVGEKRKRDDEDEDVTGQTASGAGPESEAKKAKQRKGPKGVNPLSAKKPKRREGEHGARPSGKYASAPRPVKQDMPDRIERQIRAAQASTQQETSQKRRRKSAGESGRAEIHIQDVTTDDG